MNKKYESSNQTYRMIISIMAVVLLFGLVLPFHSRAEAAVNASAANGTVEIQNYFEATGESTNSRFKAKGVYFDRNGAAHVLIYVMNNANYQPFTDTVLNGNAIPDVSWKELGANTALVLPDGSTMSIGNTVDSAKYGGTIAQILDLYVGPMILQAVNNLSANNKAGGFEITGMQIKVKISYSITKSVDKPSATIGDELIYTIAVRNDGDISLSGIDVTDTIPAGITILGMSLNNKDWSPIAVGQNGVITLETGLSLSPGAAKTYYVKAYVNENTGNGNILTNTATIAGALIPEKATANVAINTEAVTVKKIVTGNFGDKTRVFSFTVAAVKGTHYSKEFTFDLSHNQTYTLPNLPKDAVLTLAEKDSGYAVSVIVDGAPLQRNADGKYTINVSGMGVKAITVDNEKNIIIDTGISLDSLPYVLIILIVTAAGLAFMVTRLRKIRR